MFRMWAKIFKENRMIKDLTISNNASDLTRTQKILQGLDEVCIEFDLGKPIWLEANKSEFKQYDRVRFRQENFIEAIDFDFLELHVIEED